jgi:hypothetical protein
MCLKTMSYRTFSIASATEQDIQDTYFQHREVEHCGTTSRKRIQRRRGPTGATTSIKDGLSTTWKNYQELIRLIRHCDAKRGH